MYVGLLLALSPLLRMRGAGIFPIFVCVCHVTMSIWHTILIQLKIKRLYINFVSSYVIRNTKRVFVAVKVSSLSCLILLVYRFNTLAWAFHCFLIFESHVAMSFCHILSALVMFNYMILPRFPCRSFRNLRIRQFNSSQFNPINQQFDFFCRNRMIQWGKIISSAHVSHFYSHIMRKQQNVLERGGGWS